MVLIGQKNYKNMKTQDMTHGSQELACSAEGGCEIVDLVAV